MPQVALGYPFLMHGILALSALHLASLETNRCGEWTAKAFTHQALALPEFRAAMSTISKDTSHAIFAFSGIVVSYAQATASIPASLESVGGFSYDILPGWFYLLRGTGTLLRRTWPWLEEGPFSTLLRRSRFQIDCTCNPDDDHLAALLPLYSSSTEASNESETEMQLCLAALEELRRASCLPHSPCHSLGERSAAFISPLVVPEGYVHLIRTKNPRALIILAHYCVLLEQGDRSSFMHHQAEQIFCSVAQCLDESWKSWIAWPESRITAIQTARLTS